MSLFGAFTGSAQRRRLEEANRQATGFLNEGYNNAEREGRNYYNQAQGFLSPYAQSGVRANALYSDALGMNGAEGGQRAQAAYGYARNPYLQYEQDQAQAGLDRMANARGGLNSGMNVLAAARARMGLGYQDNNAWLNRLGGEAQRGGQFAGMQSQLASGFGNQLMGLYTGRGQQLAANAQQFGNAMAQNEGTFFNNLMGLGNLGVRAAAAYMGVPGGGAGGGA